MSEAEDIHTCMAWIQEYAPEALAEEYCLPTLNKAGIIPCYGTPTKLLLMKPWEKKKHLGPPPWQLIKGTRMVQTGNSWQDYDDPSPSQPCETLEPLLCTALRESMEEAGLRLENIAQIHTIGEHHYSSLSRGTPKSMYLYAAQMHTPDNFDWPDDTHPTTGALQWFKPNALPDDVREDVMDAIALNVQLATS